MHGNYEVECKWHLGVYLSVCSPLLTAVRRSTQETRWSRWTIRQWWVLQSSTLLLLMLLMLLLLSPTAELRLSQESQSALACPWSSLTSFPFIHPTYLLFFPFFLFCSFSPSFCLCTHPTLYPSSLSPSVFSTVLPAINVFVSIAVMHVWLCDGTLMAYGHWIV